MVKKLAAGLALVCASLVVATPAANAALTFAGVYPNHSAAAKACRDGVAQGRWYNTCQYRAYQNTSQVGLYVQHR